MTTPEDRRLLEMAAKAAGIPLRWHGPNVCCTRGDEQTFWNPLDSDADALRLLVKTRIQVEWTRGLATHTDEWLQVYPQSNGHLAEFCRLDGPDECAIARGAIVRAAAAIGEQMP